MGDDEAATPPPTDEALLAAIAAGDERAFAALYGRHCAHAHALAQRILRDHGAAEEVVQEVFLRVWRRAATFNPARGDGRTWLLASVAHGAIGRTRGRWARERQTLPLDPAHPLVAPDDPAGLAEAAERVALVRAGLARLPAPQRTALELHYFGELTCAELAARTAATVGTVKSRLRLGKARLRESLAPLAPARDEPPAC